METTEEKKCCETKRCCCLCHKMPGVFIALIGVVILLTGLDVFGRRAGVVAIAVLIILLGLQRTCAGACKCCSGAGDGTCEKK